VDKNIGLMFNLMWGHFVTGLKIVENKTVLAIDPKFKMALLLMFAWILFIYYFFFKKKKERK
jgi:hypothetical protein